MNTPETDATPTYYCESDEECISPLVDQDFARRLEQERNTAIRGFVELRDLLDRCSIDECPPDFSKTLEALDTKLKPLIKL